LSPSSAPGKECAVSGDESEGGERIDSGTRKKARKEVREVTECRAITRRFEEERASESERKREIQRDIRLFASRDDGRRKREIRSAGTLGAAD